MKEKSAKHVVQVYLSRMSTHKGGSTVILSDDGAEFKNTILNDACDNLA